MKEIAFLKMVAITFLMGIIPFNAFAEQLCTTPLLESVSFCFPLSQFDYSPTELMPSSPLTVSSIGLSSPLQNKPWGEINVFELMPLIGNESLEGLQEKTIHLVQTFTFIEAFLSQTIEKNMFSHNEFYKMLYIDDLTNTLPSIVQNNEDEDLIVTSPTSIKINADKDQAHLVKILLLGGCDEHSNIGICIRINGKLFPPGPPQVVELHYDGRVDINKKFDTGSRTIILNDPSQLPLLN